MGFIFSSNYPLIHITHEVTIMSFDEAMLGGHKVSLSEALREVEDHGISPTEFLNEVGTKDEYSTREVLEWLGY